MDLANFNTNGIGLDNGNFIGLPFTEEQAKIVIISVPWDVTVSYSDGTSTGPDNILQASLQLDLFDPEIEDAWKLGIYLRPSNPEWKSLNEQLRPLSKKYIAFLEEGGTVHQNAEIAQLLKTINKKHEQLNWEVFQAAKDILDQGKIAAIVGGEHSVPLGLLRALKDTFNSFGVLHIDAHMDLRHQYEDFSFSHASIFNNAIHLNYIDKLVQVGIRDFCDQEVEFAMQNHVKVFYDHELKANQYQGKTWHQQCMEIIDALPQNVYISFDIDGLNPQLCPNTGTPVPGGLEFNESLYLIRLLVESGRKIIGFDLCEVGGLSNEWDGNVGARILYKLCNWTGKSNGLI
ncbi:MAG: agmatinase family protein [Salinivirgaceae bacterium]|jgi:agmatinase